jgi:hypothetical protein
MASHVRFPAILLLLIGASLGSPANAVSARDRETVTAQGEGEAETRGEEYAVARGEALEDALRKAFENALTEILPLDFSLTGRQEVLEQLGPRLKKYLLQYRILSEMPAQQVFFVNVEATFSVPLVREDLVALGLAWAEESAGEPVALFVRVQGVGSFRSYMELIQLIRGITDVRSVTPYEVFGSAVVFRVEYRRTLHDLVDAISALHSSGSAFRIERVSDNEVSLSLMTTSGQSMDR